MQNDRDVPDYLQDIYEILKCAYPSGLNEDEYWSVLSILHQIMSFWTIAHVLSVLTNKDRSEVYNDASGFGLDAPPTMDDVERVKSKLDSCGYDDWFKTNKFWAD